MRAIRYGDSTETSERVFEDKFQSAMRAIRYGALYTNHRTYTTISFNPLCVQLDMVCRRGITLTPSVGGFNPLCVQLDMVGISIVGDHIVNPCFNPLCVQLDMVAC